MSDLKFYIGQSNGRHFEAKVSNLIIDIKNENVILCNECYEVDSESNRIATEFSAAYGRNLVANNSTLVHPKTGQYWGNLTEEEKGDAEPIGEWDFFWFVAQNVDIRVIPFIQQTLANNRTRLMPEGFTIDNPSVPDTE